MLMKKNFFVRSLKWILICFSIFILSFILLNFLFPLKPPPEFSRIITDKDGTIMYAFLSPDEKWRMKTNLDEINPLLRKTLLFKEDKYFYFHPGINPVAVIRASFNNIT